jgi:hypothetical protein
MTGKDFQPSDPQVGREPGKHHHVHKRHKVRERVVVITHLADGTEVKHVLEARDEVSDDDLMALLEAHGLIETTEE